jgi:regulator of protease activity HflC (stomatin/prohibitin superfamily)
MAPSIRDYRTFLKDKYLPLFAFFWILVILLGNSIKVLTPLEMGLAKNTIASSIDKTKVYMGGRYWLGLGKEFVIYPSEIQYLHMELITGSSKDKQVVLVDVMLQYKLLPDHLVDLYAARQQSYASFFRRVVETTVKDVCVLWETIPEFYEERIQIANNMETAIANIFSENHAEVHGFQLLNIKLADATENKIIETLVAEQAELTETTLQKSTLVRTGMKSYTEQAKADKSIILSEANALGIQIRADGEAKAFTVLTQAQGGKINQLITNLQLSNVGQLLAYSWYNMFTSQGQEDGDFSQRVEMVIGSDGVSQGALSAGPY